MPKFSEVMREQGLCDVRGAAFCATATALPNGEVGIVALCVRGHRLYLYDVVDLKSELGELLYTVELPEIRDLKIRMRLLKQLLRFTWRGDTFAFTNFLGVRDALNVIKEESGL